MKKEKKYNIIKNIPYVLLVLGIICFVFVICWAITIIIAYLKNPTINITKFNNVSYWIISLGCFLLAIIFPMLIYVDSYKDKLQQ